jgi:NTP pyrophosphatase (non-canonical NTP hydrolase)
MSRLEKITEEIIKFRNERDWKKFHTLENLSKSIVLEASELLEHFQWGDKYNNDELSDELADILIYSILFANAMNVDIIDIMGKKLKKNEKRFPIDRVYGNSGKNTKVVD